MSTDPPTSEMTVLAAKVRALEEALAFQSHEADLLRDHFLALTKALELCERRIATLELAQRVADTPREVEE